MVIIVTKGHLFCTFMRNRILGIVPQFQGKMSFCSKVMNKRVVEGNAPILNRVKKMRAKKSNQTVEN